MVKIELKTEEARVLIDFLIRFRDKEVVEFEHRADRNVLWYLCALLEQEMVDFLLNNPNYKQELQEAREAVSSDDWE